MAVGATFSALEVVPLALIGYEAWETYQKAHLASWMKKYRTIGDTVFLIGVGALAYFVIGLITGWSYQRTEVDRNVPIDSIAGKQPV